MEIIRAFLKGFIAVFVAKTAYYQARDLARDIRNKK